MPNPATLRLAAIADLHIAEDSTGKLAPHWQKLHEVADVLLLGGDLTNHGNERQAQVLAQELAVVQVPVIAVLGNHGYHANQPAKVRTALERAGITVLEGETTTLSINGVALSITGTKGFGGLGGALAVAAYIGLVREHKDVDLYVLPEQRAQRIELINQLGLEDYYACEAYDQAWIYRAHQNGTLVDVIWEMANHLAPVDEGWLTQGAAVEVEGLRLCLLPPEELIWTKFHVLQKDRCDWPDVLNLLYATGSQIDWMQLLTRLGDDAPLLTGALAVNSWLCPGAARQVPGWVWQRLQLNPPNTWTATPIVNLQRVKLIDSRPWFIPAFKPPW